MHPILLAKVKLWAALCGGLFRSAGGGFEAADFTGELIAVHAWPMAVGQQHRVAAGFPALKRFNAVLREHRFMAEQRDLALDQAQIHRMIVGDQNGGAASFARCRQTGLCQWFLLRLTVARLNQRGVAYRQAQQYRHGGAGARRAFHRNVAAHHVGKPAADRQAEAGAAVMARGFRVGLYKRLKQASLLCRRDADAGVGHAQTQLLAAGVVPERGNLEGDFARGGELDRV